MADSKTSLIVSMEKMTLAPSTATDPSSSCNACADEGKSVACSHSTFATIPPWKTQVLTTLKSLVNDPDLYKKEVLGVIPTQTCLFCVFGKCPFETGKCPLDHPAVILDHACIRCTGIVAYHADSVRRMAQCRLLVGTVNRCYPLCCTSISKFLFLVSAMCNSHVSIRDLVVKLGQYDNLQAVILALSDEIAALSCTKPAFK